MVFHGRYREFQGHLRGVPLYQGRSKEFQGCIRSSQKRSGVFQWFRGVPVSFNSVPRGFRAFQGVSRGFRAVLRVFSAFQRCSRHLRAFQEQSSGFQGVSEGTPQRLSSTSTLRGRKPAMVPIIINVFETSEDTAEIIQPKKVKKCSKDVQEVFQEVSGSNRGVKVNFTRFNAVTGCYRWFQGISGASSQSNGKLFGTLLKFPVIP